MKKVPLRLKIVLWFSMALTVVVAMTFVLILSVSNSVMQKNLGRNLAEIVERNLDEIEYCKSLDNVNLDSDTDQYFPYEDGYIEIDDDFLESVNGIITALYNEDKELVYGENPIAQYAAGVSFSDRKLQRIKCDGEVYYLYDRQLTNSRVDGMWLRGVVSEKAGQAQLSDVTKWSLILLPIILIVAILGGDLIAKKSLEPIKRINEVAEEIGNSHDLKKRINLNSGNDELYLLASTFDRMFDRLEQAFMAEKQFTSDVSHELRTPMAVILAQCEYALEEPMESEDYEKTLNVIVRQSKKMSHIISDMLDFTRLEMKSDKYNLGKLNMSELLNSTCEDLALISDKNISLTYSIIPDVFICGNRQLITRLLTNLVSNAYKYGKENGSINVSFERSETGYTLKVSDNGIGIKAEDMDKIFNRFYQADPSHASGGTGLGLSMVKEIVIYHDWQIDVDSTYGEGTSFIISIKED